MGKKRKTQPNDLYEGFIDKHPLFYSMHSLFDEMASDYKQIQRRVHLDPGTAGDEAEERWAALLRSWLPATFPVVTKGRIIASTGEESPQVDILILDPNYPLALRDSKRYLASGVLAAFECKLTLRSDQIRKIFINCANTKELYKMPANVFGQLYGGILYGVLAYSHNWTKVSKTHSPAWTLAFKLQKLPAELEIPPPFLPDIVCIADLATYSYDRSIRFKEWLNYNIPEDRDLGIDKKLKGAVIVFMFCYARFLKENKGQAFILGALVKKLYYLLAYRKKEIQLLAEDLSEIGIEGGGIGSHLLYKLSYIDRAVLQKLEENGPSDELWSLWRMDY